MVFAGAVLAKIKDKSLIFAENSTSKGHNFGRFWSKLVIFDF